MLDTQPLVKFAARCQAAAKTRAGEVRLDINDAMEIASVVLALLSQRDTATSQRTVQTNDPIDGGGFA